MTQSNYLIGANQSGTAYRTADNLGKQALLTFHKGSSRPTYAEQGMLWVDDSSSPICLLKYYDGTSDLTIGTLDESGNTFTPANAATVNGSTNYAVATGSSNAYAITVTPARTSYTQGEVFQFKANFTNTSGATLNVSGLGAKNIYKRVSQPLVGGDIPLNAIVSVVYDGTNFQLLNVLSSGGSGGISEVDTINADYSVDEVTDGGKLFLVEGGTDITLPDPADAGNGFQVSFRMMKNSAVSFEAASAGNVFKSDYLGAATSTYVLENGFPYTITFICDGTYYYLTDTLSELARNASTEDILIFDGISGELQPVPVQLNSIVTPARLTSASGTTQKRGMVLQVDAFDDTLFGESVELSRRTFFYDDYCEQFSRSYTGFTGAGSSVTGGAVRGRPGILSLATGTTTTGGAIVGQVSANRYINVTNGDMMFETSIRLPVLSTSGQEYIAFFGLNDKGTTISSTHPTNGVYFYYSRLANGNVWAIRTMSGGTPTDTVLGTAVTTSWFKLKILVHATSARFYINDTLVGTITTNIPTALIGFSDWISKTAGTTSTLLYADYMMISEEVAR